jgi:Serine incorporator (Serinc)
MKNDTAAVIHDGWWTAKFLIVAVLFVISMWIPNTPVIIGYMKFSRIFSVFFLSYQAMIMLVVSYVINDKLVSGVNNHGKGSALSGSGIALIVLFIIFTCGNITWIVY